MGKSRAIVICETLGLFLLLFANYYIICLYYNYKPTYAQSCNVLFQQSMLSLYVLAVPNLKLFPTTKAEKIVKCEKSHILQTSELGISYSKIFF